MSSKNQEERELMLQNFIDVKDTYVGNLRKQLNTMNERFRNREETPIEDVSEYDKLFASDNDDEDEDDLDVYPETDKYFSKELKFRTNVSEINFNLK